MVVFLPAVLLALTPALQRERAALLVPREPVRVFGAAGAELPRTGALGPFADLDGDGDVDFLNGDHRYRNDGSGIFRAGSSLGLADEARVIFFHADGDGRLDLLSRTGLYLGDGAGGFAAAPDALPGGRVADAGLALDVDGNGSLDLVTVQRRVFPVDASVCLALNDGSALFLDATSGLPASPARAWTVAGGDLDGDGDADLLLGVEGPEELWRNDGSGGFAKDGAALPVFADTTRAVVLVDLENDGDLDLVVADSPGPDRLFLNDGSGLYSSGVLPAPGKVSSAAAVLVLDREGDGDPDLVFLDESESLVPFGLPLATPSRLLVNDGAGNLAASSDLPAVAMRAVAGHAGDLDGDGDPDLVVQDKGRPNRVFWNDGMGHFTTVGEELHHVDPFLLERAGALADLDGDGLIDALTPSRVLRNDPPGVLSPLAGALPTIPAGDVAGFRYVTDLALGDLDGDGDPDAYLCVAAEFGGRDRIWINDGSAAFTDETAARFPSGGETSDNSWSARMQDLDGDGDLDLMVVRPADGACSIYSNSGAGVFTHAQNLFPSLAGAFGDFDADGAPDWFQGADFFNSPNALYRNDGSGGLALDASAIPAHAGPLTIGAVAVGDLDGDGDLDLYASRSSVETSPPSIPQPSYVYVNDGTGHFADEPARLPHALAGRDAYVADLDLDGDADLLAAREVFLNDGTGFFRAAGRRAPDWGAWNGHERMAVADLDLDGDPDALVVSENVDSLGVGLARHLEALGPARLGKSLTLVVHGPPGSPFSLLESRGRARLPLGAAGTLLVDPGRIVFATSGTLGLQGELRFRRAIPSSLALLGTTTYWQAFVGAPTHGTNQATTTITGL